MSQQHACLLLAGEVPEANSVATSAGDERAIVAPFQGPARGGAGKDVNGQVSLKVVDDRRGILTVKSREPASGGIEFQVARVVGKVDPPDFAPRFQIVKPNGPVRARYGDGVVIA